MSKKEFKKKTYIAPKIEKIIIDKNISMVMMSTPPTDPPSGSIFPFGNIFK